MTKHNGHDLLEVSIIGALRDAKSSSEIAALISKVEADLVQTEQEALEAEHVAADIEASPDAAAALAAAATARQRYDRLVAVLPRLRVRYAEVAAQEYAARWVPQYREVAAARDVFNTDEADHLIALLRDYIGRAQQLNQTISHVNATAPAGEHRRLPEIDLRWTMTNNLVLTDPATGHQIWPDPRAAIEAALLVSGTVPEHDPREWWERNEERQQQQQDANEEMAQHYAELTRTQEERQNRELAAQPTPGAQRGD
jgi:hypothetical protein